MHTCTEHTHIPMHTQHGIHTESIQCRFLKKALVVGGGGEKKNEHSLGLPSIAVIRVLMLCYLKPCQFHFYSKICFRGQEES